MYLFSDKKTKTREKPAIEVQSPCKGKDFFFYWKSEINFIAKK